MWESSNIITSAQNIAAQARLNWVVKVLSVNEKHFDGMKFTTHVFDNGLVVNSDQHGLLYETKVDDDGNHTITTFHPGPWVNRALAEAQAIEDKVNQADAVAYTPVDF